MKKLAAAILTAAAMLICGAPQASAALTVVAGFMVEGSDGWCTVSFADPYNPHIAYTAAHCYQPGTDPSIRIASAPLGRYNQNLYNPDLDIVAINLERGVPSSNTTMLGERIIGSAKVNIGDTVCKYGATTQETCGEVFGQAGHYYKVNMTAKPGDSGSPIYRRSSIGNGVFIVGILQASDKKDPNAIYFTPIQLIESYLSTAYNTTWTA
ncbi:chymotrypsin family serine protease [Mycobacteroides abscessus]|uniref:hypothetical protein n=1 Tax=Mycobacteroides abscessus TaxID=36809 RepID=UPI0009A59682|nr:hypothetical protein [Mycobacteroides abscessus]SLH39019.1 membrane protein [Mycobacteroides abscessus subsp. massiliense]